MAARTSSREEIWIHDAPAVSPRTIGNSLLAAGLRSRVPVVVQQLTGEYNGALLSSVMRVMDIHMYSVDLPEGIRP